ncbi:MAG: fimbrillin family protein [Marinifilaceae bacterium]
MKIQLLTCASALLLFAACSNEDISENATVKNNPNMINFSGTTSRASAINTLSSMQGDATGFKVFGTSAASASTWYSGLDGTNNYKYTAGTTNAWGWTTPPGPLWPTTVPGYPMNFYAFYPAAATGFVATTTAPNVTAAITVQSAASAQVDYMAARANTVSRPGDGYLPLNFTHIMSKVNFGVIAGQGTSVFIQSLKVINTKSVNTYNYTTGTWGTATTPASFDYYNNTATPWTLPTGTTGNETTAYPIYTTQATLDAGTLMLMPQALTGWVPVSGTAPAATDAYIEVVYRISSATDPDNVGYTNATSHPGYTTGYSQALFVKAGFPITGTWTAAQGYTYNIYLGTVNTTGGYYLNANYIDNTGTATTLPIPTGKRVGDPVANGTINFVLKVTDWPATDTPSPLQ